MGIEVLESKLDDIVTAVSEVKRDFNTVKDTVLPKLGRHDLALKLIGTSVLALVPIMGAWNYQLKTELYAIRDKTIILEERYRFHHDSSSITQSYTEFTRWYFWQDLPQPKTYGTLLYRASMEKQQCEPILYSNWIVRSGLELESYFQAGNVSSTERAG